ncbi:MAG: cysteine peptidase family C39 domain-containing protein, partial [Bacilli bacterium]
MYFIPQISQNDCGIACLKMLLADINQDSNYLYLPYRENNRPLSYQKIIHMAERYQLTLKGFAVEEEEEIINNHNYPLIVTIRSHQNIGHAVIVKGISHHNVQIIDPNQGRYSLSLKHFFSLWDKT